MTATDQAQKLTVSKQGAAALREYAQAMNKAVDNIVAETSKLKSTYNSVAEDLGVHEEDFRDLLMHIEKAQQLASEAIEKLPPKMEEVAKKIDDYVAKHPTID